jgi:hypothetical protein
VVIGRVILLIKHLHPRVMKKRHFFSDCHASLRSARNDRSDCHGLWPPKGQARNDSGDDHEEGVYIKRLFSNFVLYFECFSFLTKSQITGNKYKGFSGHVLNNDLILNPVFCRAYI